MLEVLRRWFRPEPVPVVEMRHVDVVVTESETASPEDAKRLGREIDERVGRGIAEGEDPADTRLALDEIARQHGARIDDFSER